MKYENEKLITCQDFEEHLSDYLDKTLDGQMRKSVAAHALSCPLCHALLNEVKDALEGCHEISVPKTSTTKLEARILSMTMPETAMVCREFEDHLTDYLDGFLPAAVFHRWERHAVLCQDCTDLPERLSVRLLPVTHINQRNFQFRQGFMKKYCNPLSEQKMQKLLKLLSRHNSANGFVLGRFRFQFRNWRRWR